MKKILITGGAGFIGSHLADQLLEKGYSVLVVDDLSSGSLANLNGAMHNPGFAFVERDICSSIGDVFEENSIEAIFHLAAINKVRYSFEDPEGTKRVNVDGTRNLLEQAILHGVDRFIFASSSSVYGGQREMPLHEGLETRPQSPYGHQKLTSEEMVTTLCKENGIKAIILRYFNVFGERQAANGKHAAFIPKSIARILFGLPMEIYGNGFQRRDFTYIQNVIQANLLALTCEDSKAFGQSFNIGWGEANTVLKVAEVLQAISGKSPGFEYLPAMEEPFESEADVSKASEILGFSPKSSLEDGLKLTWAYYKSQC